MTAAHTAIFLLLLCFLVFFAYQTYRVDKLRQDLFRIRDQLFDDALDGKIQFDDKAYIVCRQLINGMIRYGHRLSIPSLVAFAFLIPRNRGHHYARTAMDSMLEGASESSLAIYKKYSDTVNLRVVEHVFSSPVFVVTALVPIVMLVLTKVGVDITGWIVNRSKRMLLLLDRTAYAQGGLLTR
jgi:hypothetical protein